MPSILMGDFQLPNVSPVPTMAAHIHTHTHTYTHTHTHTQHTHTRTRTHMHARMHQHKPLTRGRAYMLHGRASHTHALAHLRRIACRGNLESAAAAQGKPGDGPDHAIGARRQTIRQRRRRRSAVARTRACAQTRVAPDLPCTPCARAHTSASWRCSSAAGAMTRWTRERSQRQRPAGQLRRPAPGATIHRVGAACAAPDPRSSACPMRLHRELGPCSG